MKSVQILTILYFTAIVFTLAAGQYNETLYEKREKTLEKNKLECRDEKKREIIRQISSGERLILTNRKLDTEISMQLPASVHFEWGQYLIPVPTCLGVMSTLTLSASLTTDFRLDEIKPIGGFKYMKHPKSFRRSLLQVSQESYRAFVIAHTNMDKIRISTGTVPGYTKAAIKILSTGNFGLITNMLNLPLNILKTIISDNVKWSMEVGKSFERLANLTEEVHLTAVSSFNFKKTEEEKLKTKGLASKLQFDSLQQLVNNVESQLKSDAILQTRTIDEMKAAFNSIPSGINLVFMDFVDCVFVKPIGFIASIISGDIFKKGHQSKEDTSSLATNSCVFQQDQNIFAIYEKSQILSDMYDAAFRSNSVMEVYNATADTRSIRNLNKETQCQPVDEVAKQGIKTIELIHNLTHNLIETNQVLKKKDILPLRMPIKNFLAAAIQLRELASGVYGKTNTCLTDHYFSLIEIFFKSKQLCDRYYNALRFKNDSLPIPLYNASTDVETFKSLKNVRQCQPVYDLVQMGIETFEATHELTHELIPTNMVIDAGNKSQDQFKLWYEKEIQPVRKSMAHFFEAADKLKNFTETVGSPSDSCFIENYLDIIEIFSKSKTMVEQYTELQSLDSSKGKYNATEDTDFFTNLSENVILCQPVVKVIEMGIETFQQMHELAHVKKIPPSGKSIHTRDQVNSTDDVNKFKSWREREFQYVKQSINNFYVAASNLKQIVSNIPETEVDAIIESDLDNTGGSISKKTLGTAYYKIAKHSNSLKILSDAMDRNRKLLIQKSEDSIKILGEMQKLEAKQMDLKQAIEMLEDGMLKMSEMKENWSRLVIFFVGISQVIETVAGNSLVDLMNHVETTTQVESFKKTGNLKPLIIKQALEKVMKANLLNTNVQVMASTYCNISTDYLMPTVHNLDSMMKYKTSEEIIKARSQLLESSAKNAQKIGELLGNEKLRMAEKIRAHGRQVQQEYAFLQELIKKDNVEDASNY